MKTGRKFAIFLGVTMAAICTSIPFLHKPFKSNQNDLKSTGKRTQEQLLNVPLQIKSQSKPLPTVALYDEDYTKSKPGSFDDTPKLSHVGSLASLTPPPSLPRQYQSPFKSKKESKPDQSPSHTVGKDKLAANKANANNSPSILRRHKIIDGDTLRSIAAKYFGDEKLFEEIYKANQDIISSPDALPLGFEIVIPKIER